MLNLAICPQCGAEMPDEDSMMGLCPSCLLGLLDEGGDPEQQETVLFHEQPVIGPGHLLGNRYEIRSMLGRGGMGVVWRAFDLKLRVEVALKALRRELLADEMAVDLLRQEVRSARDVVSPNVCRVFDLVTEDDQELVSMEFIDGTTLLDILQERGPLDLTEATKIAAQFLSGLEAIHLADLVHRDIKPENIMITRTGRVVVMDLGIAKTQSEARTGVISGTPAYMAPEQARGEAVDARADIYSAGVVLAEMMSPEGIRVRETRKALWQALREDPKNLPEGPWKQVLARALAWQQDDRFATASALARALEEVTLRGDGVKERSPYPGLASFSEADAEFFFGREQEIESLWKKLDHAHLLAVVGASGAGKSSFLRAGVLPIKPEGWDCVICTPGTRPFTALGQVLATRLAGDADAVRDLLRFEEIDVAVSIARRWRRHHSQTLLIIDQFEELFTLNPVETQIAFAELLGRLALEADVHVLLSMRDDFMLHCHSHEALRPIFAELTPLASPKGSALRRALAQPALLSGYRFEDDQLLDDMLAEVADERGALPLLAFAAAALWERRDREKGLLTRQAYEEIGGVAGALALHAETTLERIGSPRLPAVRVIFRNLVTSQGTRAVLATEELLSVFEESETAGQILQQLIEARLLTSFEDVSADGESSAGQRIEIIHESLLASWPRLVRWRTQDADQTQLRDQLRQVAQVWEERGRADDLLWTGTSFREYELWRERYRGRMTTTEEAYAVAMESHAARRQSQRRMAVAATILVLLGVVAVITGLWLQSRSAERQAVAEARRAEASTVFALGQLEADDHPTAALAYATKSLELDDNPAIRRFALEMLWKGPTAFVLGTNEAMPPMYGMFSFDGKWLLQGSWNGKVRLWSADGSEPHELEEKDRGPNEGVVIGLFSTDSKWLVIIDTGRLKVRILALPQVREVWSLDMDFIFCQPFGDKLIAWAAAEDQGDGIARRTVVTWPLGGGEPEILGTYRIQPMAPPEYFEPDPRGNRLFYRSDGVLYQMILDGIHEREPTRLLPHVSDLTNAWLQPVADRLVTTHFSGEIGIWRRDAETTGFIIDRMIPGDQDLPSIWSGFDPTGSWVFGLPNWTNAFVWDLRAPGGTDPLVLRRGEVSQVRSATFDNTGNWLSLLDSEAMSIWPMNKQYPRIWSQPNELFRWAAADPAGKWIATTSVGQAQGRIWLWPLDPAGSGPQLIFNERECGVMGLEASPDGRYLATTSNCGGAPLLISTSGTSLGEVERLGSTEAIGTVAFDRTGLRLATGLADPATRLQAQILILNLETGHVEYTSKESARYLINLAFTPDGNVLSGHIGGGLILWNTKNDTQELLVEGTVEFSLSPDGRTVLGLQSTTMMQASGTAFLLDLDTRTRKELPSHGEVISEVSWHPSGEQIVTGDRDGAVRIGSVDGSEPHLLLGHEEAISDLMVEPEGHWILSTGEDGTVRIWPVPEGNEPFHTLPREVLLERLWALTNYRVVEDPESLNGYRIVYEPFLGWNREPPAW